MFKDSTFKIVPNNFISQQQSDYIWNDKIKSKTIKKQTQKLPFNDLTNKLSSMQNSEKPQNLQMIGYQPELEIEVDNTNIQIIQSNKILKKENVCKNYIQQVNQLNQNTFIQSNYQKKQQKDSQVKLKEKKNQQARKRIFNLDLSDSSQEQNKEQQTKQQLKEKNYQISQQNLFFEERKKSKSIKKNKITQLQIQMSDQSQAQIGICQKQRLKQNISTSERLQEIKKVDKRFILKKFDSDSECESDRMKCQNKQQEDQQTIEIIRSLNIRKLRQHYPYLKADQQLESFYPVPPQSKISLIVKRNSEKSQYIIYDGQLISQVLRVTKSMGGNFKFMMANSSKSQLKQIATMKSNFLGTEFHCYAKKESKKDEKYQSISITYQMNILGLNGPRKIKIYSAIKPIPTSNNILQLFTKNHWKDQIQINTYQSKIPKWDAQLGAFVLNLRGTASHSSIKNCIIVDEATKKKEYLIFGKKSKDIFNLQIKHPMSILQGVAFAVSSFEKKLACE